MELTKDEGQEIHAMADLFQHELLDNYSREVEAIEILHMEAGGDTKIEAKEQITQIAQQAIETWSRLQSIKDKMRKFVENE